MQIFQLALIVLAIVAANRRHLNEAPPAAADKCMPGDKAGAYYETTREWHGRLLTVVAPGLALLATGTVVYSFVLHP